MRKNNKFKIEDFQLSEGLEAILRKEHRWRVWILRGSFLICVLWISYLALCWTMDWQVDIKFPWNLLPLLLLLASAGLYTIRFPGKCPLCKRRMSEECFTKNKHCIIVHYCKTCKIYGKTGVKL
ncbi:MAG: hypothetical protein E7056_05630 [Lentisphaerae bacterium]|nr:hypothetical protein [Lentisphaerota bacterium]